MQTDNSYLNHKIKLRLDNLPQKNLKVLSAFGEDNKIWKAIQKKFPYKIDVDLIEIKQKNGIYLKGDNIKFLTALSLDKYHIIDLDAYGSPTTQLSAIMGKKYRGMIFITYIQTMFGGLPQKMLISLGYTRKMVRKIPTLFNKNSFEKLKNYLYILGFKTILYYRLNNKVYALINPA